MQASLEDFYWRLCAQYDSSAGLVKPAADNKAKSRGKHPPFPRHSLEPTPQESWCDIQLATDMVT